MARINPYAAFYRGPGFTLFHAYGENNATPYRPHFHDEYMICAQLRGEEHCVVTGKHHHFTAGDLVLINPHQVHTGNARANPDLEYINLYVDPKLVRELAQETGGATTTPEFVHVKTRDDGRLTHALVHLLQLARDQMLLQGAAGQKNGRQRDPPSIPRHADETGAPQPVELGDTLALTALLRDTLLRTFESSSNLRLPQLRSTNRVSHRNIAQAIDYIRALDPSHDPTSITLETLAAVAGLSKFYFLRQFNRVVGMTPGAYLRTLRLCHASRLMRTTKRSIVDIALSVGFCDHPSFSRAFVRHVRMTPRQYQQMPAIA
ncbi:MAG: AraC family transcriptional regulator [Nannocystaceae bacterium]